MNERNIFSLKIAASHIFLVPVVLMIILIFNIPWFPAILIPQTMLVILFFAGYWEFFRKWIKYLICLIDEIIILSVIIIRLSSDYLIHEELIILLVLALVEFYLLFLLGKILWVIWKDDKEKLEIEFPFRNGTYLVTDGGNSEICRLMNYHFHSPFHKRKNTNRSMIYATDIVKSVDKGKKFLPPENTDYPIFSESIYCPMEGRIVMGVNDIEDNIPFCGNYPYNTGNTVVIKNDNYCLLLGHLKRGSIVVKIGDTVSKNELIGECGNSGMSERPHLHMQLMKCEGEDYWKAKGISIQFQSKNLYKNRLIRN
ncbi:MAG: M23 family metallopeptidase [Bacteroidales bacterium]|nr:M23 family metallopeptidase [Bacteroidales bacterium]MCF8392143.1 M23 family metallopeptidase [Bacteroidales bacterium]